ncbi:MAG: hypothetical protein ACI9UQ_000417, partial [Candidatus Krumholzibacteriia bacterium]
VTTIDRARLDLRRAETQFSHPKTNLNPDQLTCEGVP